MRIVYDYAFWNTDKIELLFIENMTILKKIDQQIVVYVYAVILIPTS